MTRETDRRNPELQDDLVMIGEIAKPHGIRGEVKVYTFSERPDNFKFYKKIILKRPAASRFETYKVVKSREQGKLAILVLEGVASRNAAEALQGSTLWLHKADFPDLDSDEFYWHQIKGLSVRTEAGRELGKVTKLFSTPAHDIMVVADGGNEYMIPLQGDIIRTIDEQAGTVIISPPPGLLEINEKD